jgi:hypothetical protein
MPRPKLGCEAKERKISEDYGVRVWDGFNWLEID